MIILLKSIEHFIFQSAEEGFHHAIVIAVTLSGHGLNDSAHHGRMYAGTANPDLSA